jgi:hypothetical protein
MHLSNITLLARLTSGNIAAYEVQPQYLNEIPGVDLNARAIRYGKQVAHSDEDGAWFCPGGWDEIVEPAMLRWLRGLPKAWEPAIRDNSR